MALSKFRYDINGLRALSVVIVVLYHFFPELLPGGFVGVDIFFVISGFLMTSIVTSRLRTQGFYFIDFYLARLYRILPALLALCFTLFLFGLLIIDPLTFKAISKHTLSSLGFFSNIVYDAESGYFSENSRLNWLLHTWSLSVEWQFYCLYPLLAVVGYKINREKGLKLVLALALLSSLSLAIYMGEIGNSSAFYLLQTRAWELILGGAVFFFVKPSPEKGKFYLLFGFAFIFLSIFTFSEKLIWPSYNALLPTLGACFIIYASFSEHKLFSNLVITKLGLWSYSIYLWHWPILVALEYFDISQLIFKVIGVIAAVTMGALSYHYIESKISFKRNSPAKLTRLIFNKLTYSTVIIISLGFFAFKTNGFVFRFGEPIETIYKTVMASPNRNKCSSEDYNYIRVSDSCKFKITGKNYAIFGDSHSVELAQALSNEMHNYEVGLYQYSYTACPPDYNRPDIQSLCAKWTDSVIKTIVDNTSITNVIIIYRMSSHLFGNNTSTYPDLVDQKSDGARTLIISAYKDMISTLVAAGKKVTIIAPTPELGETIKTTLKRKFLETSVMEEEQVGVSRKYFDNRNEYFINILESDFSRQEKISIIYPSDYYCDRQSCFVVKGGHSLYFDDDHMSMYGARIIAQAILEETGLHTK
jgi:peptidoglycan/LPS O-acetylase OafA/YrhL